jgi:hypothetical protein
MIVLALEIWNSLMRTPRGPCRVSPPPRHAGALVVPEPSSSQTGLLAANPGLIHLPGRAAVPEHCLPSPGGVCEASSGRLRNRTDRERAVKQATQPLVGGHQMTPRTNGQGFWSGAEQSRRSARLGADSQHTVAVAGSPIRRLADVGIEGR